MPSRPRQPGSVKRQMHDRRQDRADRIAFHGRSCSALPTIASRRQGVSGLRSRPCETVSENPAIEGQGDCDQHGAAVVYCESAAVACLSSSRGFPPAPPTCGLEWIGSDRRPASPRSSSRNSRRQLFSAARAALCIAKQKSRRRPSGAGAVPFGCGPIVPGRTTTIEVAIGAARLEKGTRQWQPSAPSPRPRTA